MSQKVLVRAPNHLGDCIMALPMINETQEAHPGSHVTVLAPEHLSCLFEQNLAVDQVLTIPSAHVHGLIGVLKIKDIIAPHEFDLGYILPPSFGAAAGFKLGGVRDRVGYVADGRRLLLTKPLPLPTPLNATHRSETYFNLLRRGAGVDLEFTRPKLFVSETDAAGAERILTRQGIDRTRRYAVMSVRAVAESRRWGILNYTELIKHMISRYGCKVILIGSDSDISDSAEVAEAAGPREVCNLAGKTSLRETAAILSRAMVFIGNDSGPAHLAAAVGAPLVVLSGADDPAETSPVSPRKRLIIQDGLECISCVKNICPLKGEAHMRCMAEITLDMVMEQVGDLLRETGQLTDIDHDS